MFDSPDREASHKYLEHLVITSRKFFKTPQSERSRNKQHILPTFWLLRAWNSGKNGKNQAMFHSQPRQIFSVCHMITNQCVFDSSDREASLRYLEHLITTSKTFFETPRSGRSRNKLHVLPAFWLLRAWKVVKIVKNKQCVTPNRAIFFYASYDHKSMCIW